MLYFRILYIYIHKYKSIYTAHQLSRITPTVRPFCLTKRWKSSNMNPLMVYKTPLPTIWQNVMIDDHFCSVPVSLCSRECWFPICPKTIGSYLCWSHLAVSPTPCSCDQRFYPGAAWTKRRQYFCRCHEVGDRFLSVSVSGSRVELSRRIPSKDV